jgi:hypothetical protein
LPNFSFERALIKDVPKTEIAPFLRFFSRMISLSDKRKNTNEKGI